MNTILSGRRPVLWLACAVALAASNASAQAIIDEGFTDGAHTEGHAVALSGDLLAVGAPNRDAQAFPSGTIEAAGAVFIYARESQLGGWIPVQTIVSPDPVAHGHFGTAVALRDGFLVVGEPGYGVGAESRGRVLVYLDATGSAVDFSFQGQQLGETAKQSLGSSLALERYSDSGPFIVLAGAPGGDALSDLSRYGGVYASGWEVSGNQANSFGSKLISPVQIGIPNPAPGQAFGSSVTIVPEKCVPVTVCQNNFIIAIGSPAYNWEGNKPSAGYAIVLGFHADHDVDNWDFATDNVQVMATDETKQSGESFGHSVAIDAGNGIVVPPRLLVGIPGAIEAHEFPLPATVSGAVRVFERPLGGLTWSPVAEVYGPDDQTDSASFGRTIQADADRVWVGAPLYDVETQFVTVTNAGAVFAIDRDEDGSWAITGELHTDPPSSDMYAGFSLACDAGRLVAGAVARGGFNTWTDGAAPQSGDSILRSSFEKTLCAGN